MHCFSSLSLFIFQKQMLLISSHSCSLSFQQKSLFRPPDCFWIRGSSFSSSRMVFQIFVFICSFLFEFRVFYIPCDVSSSVFHYSSVSMCFAVFAVYFHIFSFISMCFSFSDLFFWARYHCICFSFFLNTISLLFMFVSFFSVHAFSTVFRRNNAPARQ